MKIVPLPTFERRIKKLKEKELKILNKKLDKIEKLGLKAFKVLKSSKGRLLLELKSHRPPYRLYAIYDPTEDILYLFDWIHKKEQERIIKKLVEIISSGFI